MTRPVIFAALWVAGDLDRPKQKQLDAVSADCVRRRRTILEIAHGSQRVIPERIDCDLCRFLDGG